MKIETSKVSKKSVGSRNGGKGEGICEKQKRDLSGEFTKKERH